MVLYFIFIIFVKTKKEFTELFLFKWWQLLQQQKNAITLQPLHHILKQTNKQTNKPKTNKHDSLNSLYLFEVNIQYGLADQKEEIIYGDDVCIGWLAWGETVWIDWIMESGVGWLHRYTSLR